jgi:ATP-dependent DNA ligase
MTSTFLLPSLYKKTSTGAVQIWEIRVEPNGDTCQIITTYGQLDGKQQTSIENVTEGKNLGRSNETTIFDQAVSQAQSEWDKKSKKDYRQSIDEIINESGKSSKDGGYLPMLAQSYTKNPEKLWFPCLVQSKLDGIRCISMCTEEGVTIWSRSGKKLTTADHIVKDLEKVMKVGEIWDGELYAHKEDFNTFTGALRADKNADQDKLNKIKYCLYDCPKIYNEDVFLSEPDSFSLRISALLDRLLNISITTPTLDVVPTVMVNTFDEAMEYFSKFIEDGYEGLMFRNTNMPYEQKRSYNLLKYKEFNDAEFKIVGMEEGIGKLEGHIGAFILDLGDGSGRTFKAKLKGSLDNLKYLFTHHEEWSGKDMTVKFFGRSKDNIPRFPVGVTIRWDK